MKYLITLMSLCFIVSCTTFEKNRDEIKKISHDAADEAIDSVGNKK